MDVILCDNKSERNIINKDVIELTTRTCTIKGNLSVEAPIILLAYDSTNFPNINYMKIPEFNRCYYVTDIIDLTGGRYEIHGKVDVLESFKASILNLPVIVSKASGMGAVNMFLDDGSFVTENKEFNTVINFPSGFNDNGEYILITAGGGGGII